MRPLTLYALLVYAFLHLPLLVLSVFSFNQSRFTQWEGFSLRWYTQAFGDPALREATLNSLLIGGAATGLATIAGTLCAYALWKRKSPAVSSTLYLSLMTPEIVTGVALRKAGSAKAWVYQRSEKPSHLVNRDWLKLKTESTSKGKCRNA